jgi:nucleoside-diphosphate-sugar epimerase
VETIKRIAVTGSSGFIGSHLVTRLRNLGHIVYPIGREMTQISCDRVYHLACPSTSEKINDDPTGIMDTILDVTRAALDICPTALFVNASTKGVTDLANTPQGCYNIAKRCMETYIQFSGVAYINYRIPSVYGPNMHPDMFIKRCVDGRAYKPSDPNKVHYIAHIDDVVDSLVNLEPINIEEITLGNIYENFNSGRRGLHRPTFITRPS